MKKTSRSTLNFIIDCVAFVSLVFLLSTGFLIYFILPPGQGGAMAWGLTRHEWGNIHFVFALLFATTMVVHVILHWSWIGGKVRGRRHDEKNLRYGIALVAVVSVIAIALIPYVGPRGQDTGHDDSHDSSGRHLSLEGGNRLPAIDNATTLGDIEKTTGIPFSYFAHKLELPPCASPGESLHYLKKTYGFTNKDLKKLIREYRE